MDRSTCFLFSVAQTVWLGLLLTAHPMAVAQGVEHRTRAENAVKLVEIVRDAADVPPSIKYQAPALVRVTLTAQEVMGTLDPESNSTYRYWTFNGKVPGPMIRVRQGDTIELTLRNDGTSHMAHSIDLHAALGPGGGAALTQVAPGQTKTFTFQATTPGLFVYHCGTPMIAEHMANGMYGLILVEPPEGLARVDHEYYLMQGEIYTTAPKGKPGLQQFSGPNLMQENPQYFVFNGSVDATSKQYPMHANVGDTVRVFFGNAGPNATSSAHMIGEIFAKVYSLGSLTSAPLTGIQTASVPPGGAAILELKTDMPGKFSIMDHAIARMEKGMLAVLEVKGPENAALMHDGPASLAPAETAFSGMTPADLKAATEAGSAMAAYVPPASGTSASADAMAGMPVAPSLPDHPKFDLTTAIDSAHSLIGCMSLL